MNRWLRILKHRSMDETDAARALDDAALGRIAARVADSERHHTGEIRVCVEAGLPLSYLWRGADARERAITLFGKLRVWDTADNNGVLIYLLLADHRIEVLADRGLHPHVPPGQWHSLLQGMSAEFKGGRFEAGLIAAIDIVDSALAAHFPLAAGQANPNELSDKPVVI